MIITRTLTPEAVNIDRLITEISLMAKYNSVRKYDHASGELILDVDVTWDGTDDTALDLIITNHANIALTVLPKSIPFPVTFAGGSVGYVTTAGTSLVPRANFIYPGSMVVGKHTKCLLAITGSGSGYTRVVLTDRTNSVEILDIQKVRDVNNVFEIYEVTLPEMPENSAIMEVELASGSGGTDARLGSILFLP